MKAAKWCMKPKYLDFQGNENALLFCLVQTTEHAPSRLRRPKKFCFPLSDASFAIWESGKKVFLGNSASCDDGNPPLGLYKNWLQNLAGSFLVARF